MINKVFAKITLPYFLLFFGGMMQEVDAQVSFKTKQWSLQLDALDKLISMKSLLLQKEFLVDSLNLPGTFAGS